MADNQFNDSLDQLLKGLDGFISDRTVVGNPITINDTVILPLVDVHIGVGAGAYTNKSNGTAGGMGAKMSPTALLLLQNGNARVIRLNSDDTVTKIVDMIPDVVDKMKSRKKMKSDPAVDRKVEEIRKEKEK